MSKLFCLMGKTGSGKSYYYNHLVSDGAFMRYCELKPLVYGTTRKPREGEEDGVDYHFFKSFPLDGFFKDSIVEIREYTTLNDGKIYYFTTEEYLSEGTNLICVVSPNQYVSYKRWCDAHNVDIYMIDIECSARTRISRIINNRSKSDDDVYELCRRILDENEELEDASCVNPEILDKNHLNKLILDNNTNIPFDNLIKIRKYLEANTKI